jgi:hypothetical protein
MWILVNGMVLRSTGVLAALREILDIVGLPVLHSQRQRHGVRSGDNDAKYY